MGGVVSAGETNEELVDNLCEAEYITTPEVETAFRKVDRGDYLLITDSEEERLEAYQDSAWRKGTLHLSAPCIYTRAVEALKFKQGLSFLNIGSGTGYLSTLVGLLLSNKGVNHGVELYKENVEYAREKLEEFKTMSKWYDPTEFSEPLFVVGNGLLLDDQNRRYDRVYVGAACTTDECQSQMKNLLEIDGIVVMPTDSQLVAVTRVSESEWKTDVVLSSVAFAPLILPSSEKPDDLVTFTISKEVNTLKSICRQKTLSTLTRERFPEISQLPVPTPMKTFLSGGREWDPPSPPPKNLCPLQKRKHQDDTSEEEGVARGDNSPPTHQRRRPRNGRRGRQDLQFGIRGIHGQRVVVCNFNGLVVEFPVHSLQGPDSADSSDSDGRREGEEEEGEEEGEEGEKGEQDKQAVQEEEVKQDLGEDAVPDGAGVEKRRRRRLFPFGLMSRSRQGGSDNDGDGNVMEDDPSDQKGGSSAEALAKGGDPKPPKKGGWLKGLFRRSSSNKTTGSANPSSVEEAPPVEKHTEEEAESNEEGDTPTLSDFD